MTEARERIAVIAPEDFGIQDFMDNLGIAAGNTYSILPLIGAVTAHEAIKKAAQLPKRGVSTVLLSSRFPFDTEFTGGAEMVLKEIQNLYAKAGLPIAILALGQPIDGTSGTIFLDHSPAQIRAILDSIQSPPSC